METTAQAGLMRWLEFQGRVNFFTRAIIKLLREQLQRENNQLIPRVLKLVETNGEWEGMKIQCDHIGYCSFTPEIHLD